MGRRNGGFIGKKNVKLHTQLFKKIYQDYFCTKVMIMVK